MEASVLEKFAQLSDKDVLDRRSKHGSFESCSTIAIKKHKRRATEKRGPVWKPIRI